MPTYRATVVRTNDIEHHGVKGQKWGVSRYKKARSQGLSANSKLSDAKDKETYAQIKYKRAGNKMYKNMAKRDVAKDKAESSKIGTRKKARLTEKVNKYNQKVNDYADKRNTARNEAKNAKSDIKKSNAAYQYAVRKAAKEKVQIKDHTIAKRVLVASINAYASSQTDGKYGGKSKGLGKDVLKTDKDRFDEAVMDYRNKVR